MNSPQLISVLDSSIAAYNIGNRIIMEAVLEHLTEIFPYDFIISLPMEDIKRNARRYAELSAITFVGGTNVLNCDIYHYRQWDLDFHNIIRLKRFVLMGTGWWKYENQAITRYTQWAFNRILSHDYIHSVRDSYTQNRLNEIGIKSINTVCPTLWRITPEIVSDINNKTKAKEVIVTITDYDKNYKRDQLLIDSCCRCYDKVYVFIQGTGDYDYINSIGTWENIEYIPPQIHKYDALLERKKVDYIGTRLHAGIRALQKGIRSYIISIDNRSKEMARDFGLPTLETEKLNDLDKIIESPYHITLNIPYDNIKKWKSQFLKK